MRHLNALEIHTERITKIDKMINGLDYKGIKVAVSKKIITKLKDKITFSLMYSVMKIIWSILLMYQIKNLKIVWISC